MMTEYLPYLVAVNLTDRCNLRCAHCYMDAGQRRSGDDNELSRADLGALLADIARRAPSAIVVLTGGEPLMHSDIDHIIASGAEAGLRMVLGTNGLLLDESRIKKMKSAGLQGVGISIDSVHADMHDAFRGVSGAFEKSCRAVRLCRSNGLHVQIHFTVTRSNHKQVAQIATFGIELGASIINYFFLVCVGRGKSEIDLPPDLYEESLREIARLQRDTPGVMVQARCAPHFKRVLYEDDPNSLFTRAGGYDGGGCIAATHYCRISPTGEMTPCPYIETSAGNVRDRSFWDIWDNAPLFQSFRSPILEGRCSVCEYRGLCGGCRARSLAQDGRLMGEDPNCSYVPRGGAAIPVLNDEAAGDCGVRWTRDAQVHLERIPVFLRKMIKRRLEEAAAKEGSPLVTTDMMKRMRRKREEELGVKFTS